MSNVSLSLTIACSSESPERGSQNPLSPITSATKELFNAQISPLQKPIHPADPMSPSRVARLLTRSLEPSPDRTDLEEGPPPLLMLGGDLVFSSMNLSPQARANYSAITPTPSSGIQISSSSESISDPTPSTTQERMQPHFIDLDEENPPVPSTLSQPSRKRKATTSLSTEQRLKKNELTRERRANEPPDKKAKRCATEKERSLKARAKRSEKETPKEREVRLEKERVRIREIRANETPEQREMRLAKQREARANETPEQRETRLAKQRAIDARNAEQRAARTNETQEQRETRLAKLKAAHERRKKEKEAATAMLAFSKSCL